MKNRLSLLVGPVIGLFPVSVLYFDGYWDPQLAAIIWAAFAIAGWLVVRRWDVWSTRGNRWSALLLVVVLGGTQFGIHMDLPIPEDLTIALWFLVLGIGYASAAIGVEMAATDDDSTDDLEQKSHSTVAD